MTASALPDPATEIRITTLHATRGANYWSKRPVIRMDLNVGAYDDISSADAPGVTDALVSAMPGLAEHECSIGSRGGFVLRLRRGTYAPHIIEHVALELQTMIGHDVGYGRTRGGDAPQQYTMVFEHRHEQVGMRAAALALDIVQRAFAGTLETVQPAVIELAAVAETANTPPIHQSVFCGITGGAWRAETQELLLQRREHSGNGEELTIDVSPAFLLQAGLPYSRSEIAVITDVELNDVPERYREPERAQRLVSIVSDAVRTGGYLICPAKEWAVQDYAREEQCRVAIFATDDDVTWRDKRVASAVAFVRDGMVWLETTGEPEEIAALNSNAPLTPQVVAALAEAVTTGPLAEMRRG